MLLSFANLTAWVQFLASSKICFDLLTSGSRKLMKISLNWENSFRTKGVHLSQTYRQVKLYCGTVFVLQIYKVFVLYLFRCIISVHNHSQDRLSTLRRIKFIINATIFKWLGLPYTFIQTEIMKRPRFQYNEQQFRGKTSKWGI